MSTFAVLFRSALLACCLSRWMIAGAASTHEIEQELNYAAKIYASIAEANCENDRDKFSNFYQNVRKSIQEEGKFEHYFPDKGELYTSGKKLSKILNNSSFLHLLLRLFQYLSIRVY